MTKRLDPAADMQLRLPIPEVMCGATLEAQIARVQRRMDGMTTNQLRQLYFESRKAGEEYFVCQAIEDALIDAIRETVDDTIEDMPNEAGVYDNPDLFIYLNRAAVRISIEIAQTRWGYVAAYNLQWADMTGCAHPVTVTCRAYRRETEAAAAAIAAAADWVKRYEDAAYDPKKRADAAMIIGLLAEHASLLRAGLLNHGKTEKSPVKRAKKAA